MPTPVVTTTSTSATGDIITGTAANFLVMGMPVATLTSVVSGAACVGVLASSTCVSVLVNGMPLANITSQASGANPATGVPVATVASLSTPVNFIC